MASQQFSIKLRLPTWSRGIQFLPGTLYRFTEADAGQFGIRVNGEAVSVEADAGWVTINRLWEQGDVLELTLGIPARFSIADARVEADRGRLALTRGPLVYCVEQADNWPGCGSEEVDPARACPSVTSIEDGPLVDVPAIDVVPARRDAAKRLRFVPYYAWNNRGDGEMAIWLPQGVEQR